MGGGCWTSSASRSTSVGRAHFRDAPASARAALTTARGSAGGACQGPALPQQAPLIGRFQLFPTSCSGVARRTRMQCTSPGCVLLSTRHHQFPCIVDQTQTPRKRASTSTLPLHVSPSPRRPLRSRRIHGTRGTTSPAGPNSAARVAQFPKGARVGGARALHPVKLPERPRAVRHRTHPRALLYPIPAVAFLLYP